MFKLFHVSRQALFPTPQSKLFPSHIYLLADLKIGYAQATPTADSNDIDVVIGSHHQAEEVSLAIENYQALESQARLHFLIIESSSGFSALRRIPERDNLSKIFILSPLRCTSRSLGGNLAASNGAALAAALGSHFGAARYAFFSHSDMMGYKKDFISSLCSRLDDNTVIASFTQRHIIPFTGGMIYDKQFFQGSAIDWLPKGENSYHLPQLDALRPHINHMNWIDAGEQFIYAALQQGKRAHICASRGLRGDFFGHPLQPYEMADQDTQSLGPMLHFASLPLTREEFAGKYPELARSDYVWRKCFDEQGDLVFIHRGRGATRRQDHRGDFTSFVRDFNRRLATV